MGHACNGTPGPRVAHSGCRALLGSRIPWQGDKEGTTSEANVEEEGVAEPVEGGSPLRHEGRAARQAGGTHQFVYQFLGAETAENEGTKGYEE